MSSSDTKKSAYVQLGNIDVICKRTRNNPVLSTVSTTLHCKVRKYEDLNKPVDEHKKSIVLFKTETCGNDVANNKSPPIQTMGFSLQAFHTFIQIIKIYVDSLRSCVKDFSSIDNNTKEAKPSDYERHFQKEKGMFVNETIPTIQALIDENKKRPAQKHITHHGNMADQVINAHWKKTVAFTNPQSHTDTRDEVTGFLIRTEHWGDKAVNPMNWWGITIYAHRIDDGTKEMISPNSYLTFSPKETLSFLTYIIAPYKDKKYETVLKLHLSTLLHEVVSNLMANNQQNCSGRSNAVEIPCGPVDNTVFMFGGECNLPILMEKYDAILDNDDSNSDNDDYLAETQKKTPPTNKKRLLSLGKAPMKRKRSVVEAETDDDYDDEEHLCSTPKKRSTVKARRQMKQKMEKN